MSKLTAHQRKDPNRVRRLARLRQHFITHPHADHHTGQLRELYIEWGFGPKRSTVKADTKTLAAEGFVVPRGPETKRSHRLNRARLVNL